MKALFISALILLGQSAHGGVSLIVPALDTTPVSTAVDPGTDNLIAAWSFDAEVSNVWEDIHSTFDFSESSGNAAATATAVDGNAVDIVAANSDRLANASFSNTFHQSDFTVSIWIRPNIAGNFGHFGQFGGSAATRHWGFERVGGFFKFEMRNSANNAFDATASTNKDINVWYHLVGMRSSGEISIWVDGIKQADVATFSGTEVSGAQSLILGYNADRGQADGQYDDARIYNRALTANEVLWLFENPGIF